MDNLDRVFGSEGRKEDKIALVLLIKMMKVDGSIDANEKAYLRNVCQRMKISPKVLAEVVRHPERVRFEPPQSVVARVTLLVDLIWMMLADARIDPREMDLALKAAKALGFPPLTVPVLVAKFISDIKKAMKGHQGQAVAKQRTIDEFLQGG